MASKQRSKPRAATKPTVAATNKGEMVKQFERWVDAQKAVVRRVGDFVVDATDMTIQGQWSPARWLESYGHMWVSLARDLQALSKR